MENSIDVLEDKRMIEGLRIGFCVTGSFCTINNVIPEMDELISFGNLVYPIFSESVAQTDTRFGKAEDFIDEVYNITGNKPMTNINQVEPIGPKKIIDVLVIAPCTGNTLAKIANGIADTPVTLAVKSHLRNNAPVVIALSTNDGLGANAQNIGSLMARKNIYFVPFRQDDYKQKANSLVAGFNKIAETIKFAMQGKQIEPILL